MGFLNSNSINDLRLQLDVTIYRYGFRLDIFSKEVAADMDVDDDDDENLDPLPLPQNLRDLILTRGWNGSLGDSPFKPFSLV